MANEWLTPLQQTFLQRFFDSASGQRFFLTGGTCLAAFYLHHRQSDDLDLFTLDDLALPEADILVPQLATELDCRIGRARRTEHFRQFLLEPAQGPPLQVDLVRDFGPQYGQHTDVSGVIIDSIENIGANKLTAILGRTEPKDYVDLYFILQAGYDFDDLMTKAQQKDLGLQPFFMAGALLQVQSLARLPLTVPPLVMADLQAFMVALADRLLDNIRPPVDSG